MSNKSRLQTNNTNLQGLINKANALPDAGSGSGEDLDSIITELETKVASLNTTLDGKASGGGGGEGVETCTVSIDVSATPVDVYYVSASGEPVHWIAEMPLETPAPFGCKCGSLLFIISGQTTLITNGAEFLGYGGSTSNKILFVTASDGETVTISAQ